MSNGSGTGGGAHLKMVIGGIGTIVVGFTVTFLNPLAEKKGKEFAGANSAVVDSSNSSKDGIQDNTSHISDRGPSETSLGEETSDTQLSAGVAVNSSNNSRVNVTITDGKCEADSGGEPYSTKKDLELPRFEDTDEVKYFDSSGMGYSADRRTAVFNALDEALSKQGAEMSSEIRMKLLSETSRLNKFRSSKSEQSIASTISMATGGLIRWWDIESEHYDGKKYEIKIECVLAKVTIQAARHATRKTVVVLPFRLDSDATVVGRKIAASELGRQFRESLVTYLVNSRKFAVLDKSFTDELDRLAQKQPEMDPIQRAINAARTLGAEYAVVGMVNGLGVNTKDVGSLTVPLADGLVRMRIIELSNRQTVLASDFQVADLPDLNLSGGHPENSIADVLGRLMSDRTLESIYPFKVAALNGPEEVILNRGGDDLTVGQQFDLLNPGDEIKDPSTGESLGLSERKVGVVEIIRVTPKTSTARVIGRTEDISVGAICRKQQFVSGKTKSQSALSAKNDIDKLFD
jgi:hypothetical protein